MTKYYCDECRVFVERETEICPICGENCARAPIISDLCPECKCKLVEVRTNA